MIKVHAVHQGNRHLYEDAVEQHFRIRHDIYVGERRWMVLARPDGREVDQFDTDEAVYLLAMEEDRVVGGSCLVPTEPHLLNDVFPRLANVGACRANPAYSSGRASSSFRQNGRVEATLHGRRYRLLRHSGVLSTPSHRAAERGLRGVLILAFWHSIGPRDLGAHRKDGMTVVGITCDMTEAALARTRATYGFGSVLVENASRYPVCPPWRSAVSRSRAEPTEKDVILYAEEMISEALRAGSVDPALALELVHYATETDLVVAIRTFARLDEAQRADLIGFAQALGRKNGGRGGERELVH